jgi:hypothetical protein
MRSRAFTEEEETTVDSPSSAASEYAFEGFDIEFSEKILITPLTPGRNVVATAQSRAYRARARQFTLDPDRAGSFIIPDIYPHDLGGNPRFEVLPGLVVDGKEVVGCVVKASEGTGWKKESEDWFKNAWRRLRDVAPDRYGVDFFRGCYHFLRFKADGAAQADYMCDLVDAAGGWGDGDLMPWVDVEEGGQGNWAPQRLSTITDPAVRKRLIDDVTTCTTAFVNRFKERTGLRIAVYGRGLFRDLQMTDCQFGADASVNPAYTPMIRDMDQFGVPIEHIIFWQIQGTEERGKPGSNRAQVAGFPWRIGDWGQVDYSVYIDGNNKGTLKSLRERCLARRP